MCYRNRGEFIKAYVLFQQASENDLDACIYHGFCLEHGVGVDKNGQEATVLYQKGFEVAEKTRESSPAAAFIPEHCSHTSNGQQDRNWNCLFKQTVEEGGEHGLTRLGLMYKYGKGIEQNFGEAVKLLLLAEKKGSNIAGDKVGKLYFEGERVQKDDIGAATHFRRAADNGCTSGCIQLARTLSEG